MEVRYMIRTTQAATPKNVNNLGVVTERICGKSEEILYEKGSVDGWFDKNWLTARNVLEYGYKRECDAKRSFFYRSNHSDYAWTCTAEIVRYEIETPLSAPAYIVTGFVG